MPIWDEKNDTHTIREFLDGFTNILEAAQNISQTCSSPKATCIIIEYQGSSLEM